MELIFHIYLYIIAALLSIALLLLLIAGIGYTIVFPLGIIYFTIKNIIFPNHEDFK